MLLAVDFFSVEACHGMDTTTARRTFGSIRDTYTPMIFPNHTCPLHTTSGCEKREEHKNCSLVLPEKASPVTGTTLRTTGPVPADSRQ